VLITYFRSSSYNTHDDCEQRYYLEYNLGWKGGSNIKADKGTIVHKVLEILAAIKLGQQNNQKSIVDDVVGKVSTKTFNIDDLVDKVFSYYSEQFAQHPWSSKDLADCRDWANKARALDNGMFDPLKRTIIAPELHFDFQIDKPWAKYSYNVTDSSGIQSRLEGQLALKGTIDLVTDVGNNMYEIVDWKTGRRLNWATGEEKSYEKLQQDPQLRLYHYAASKVFPDVDQIMITIFFINDGGPFSIIYSKDDLPKTEEMIRKKFELIRNVQVPRLNRSWKCTKLCHFGKNTFAGTNIKPIQEFRTGQVTPKGQLMTMCEQIKFEIGRKKMHTVNQEYTAPEHNVGKYKAPGEIG